MVRSRWMKFSGLICTVAVAVMAALTLAGCDSAPKTAQEVFERYADVSDDIESAHMKLEMGAEVEFLPDEKTLEELPDSTVLTLPLNMDFEGDFSPKAGAHGTFDFDTDLSFFLQFFGAAPNEGVMKMSAEMYLDTSKDESTTFVNVDDDDEGWMRESSKLSDGALDMATGQVAPGALLDHAEFAAKEDEYVVTFSMEDVLADGSVRDALMEDAKGEDAKVMKDLIDGLTGKIVYRFDAESGYLRKVSFSDLSFESAGTPSTGDMGFALSLDVTVAYSDYNAVDAKDVAVPKYVKDSAIDASGPDSLLGEELGGMMGADDQSALDGMAA